MLAGQRRSRSRFADVCGGDKAVTSAIRKLRRIDDPLKDRYVVRGFLPAHADHHSGNLLRDPSVHDPLTDTHWSVSLLFSCVLDILPIYKATGNLQGMSDVPLQDRAARIHYSTDPAIIDVINKYNAFVTLVEQLGLPSAIEEKPRLDVSPAVRLPIHHLTHSLTRETKSTPSSASNPPP